MAKQAPNPVDVQDFQFILQCRFKVFANEDNAVFSKPCNLVASASRFGLIFIGTASPAFQVIQLKTIENHTVKEGEITNYNHRNISLPSSPKHLAINCDCTRLAVVVEQNGCAIALIYDVISMMKEVLPLPMEIRLSPTPEVYVVETSWNPTIPNIFTACKNDGTLGVYEFKEMGLDINELPAESQATCMCWSPKGKQIAVGSRNGKITQYKPDLKAMKVVNPPPLEGAPAVIALQWISNYQFIALYKPQTPDSGASLLVVDAPKTGETSYTNYDDICYSYGYNRPPQFYTVFQPIWNILMVASSNSMEVGVLGNISEQWMLWILADSARAELPLSISKQETLPIGLAFDASATEPVIWGESSLPPAPYLLLLSHHGLLCCFRVINIRSGVASICQPPEPLSDTSGLNQFFGVSSVETTKDSQPKPEIQKIAAATPPKSVEAIPQTPLSFPQSSLSLAASKLPQVPLFTNPSSSLFGPGPPFSFTTPISEPACMPKPDSGPLFVPKTVAQSTFGGVFQQSTVASIPTPAPSAKTILTVPTVATNVTPTVSTAGPLINLTAPAVSPAQAPQSGEVSGAQEDADLLISKLIREECETLEAELKALLHKGRALKIDLGTDTEAVELVHGADQLEEFLKEVTETSAGQAAEVHTLKQGLVQTWGWYEDARSRFAQTQNVALEALLRIQQLDPVSQRYLADIEHMTYYLNSQLMQASRVLDEQWENFQDSCRKIIKLKIPTMETIYQTMVRQSAIHQRQQYVLKDISSRIRAQRTKMANPTLLISLNNADQLEKELRRLQLEPQRFLQAQCERVFQNQQQLTSSKVQKLSKLLLDREIIRVTYNKPKLSTSSLKAAIHASPQKVSVEQSLLGAGLSPITTSKHPEPRALDFVQSTPKVMPLTEQKQNIAPVVTSAVDVFKAPLSNISIKFTSSAPAGTPAQTKLGQLPVLTAVNTGMKVEPAQFKFTTIPTTTAPSTSTTISAAVTSSNQLNFGFDLVSSTSKITSTPVSFTATPASQSKTTAENNQTKPSVSLGSLFGSTKPTSSFFNFNLTTTGAITTTTKPVAINTPSSAFVPTAQLPFSFSAKVPISTSTANSVTTSTTVSKSSTFVFGTATSGFGSTTTLSSQLTSATVTTTVNTMPVTVVTSSVPAASSSIFGALKTSANTPALTSVVTPVPIQSFKISAAEGFSAPKTSGASISEHIATELAAVPSSETVVSASSTDKGTAVALSTNQTSLFGTVTSSSQASLYNFANAAAKFSQPIAGTTTTKPAASDAPVPVIQPEKEPPVFGKVTSAGGSILTTPSVASTATASIFGSAALITTASSIFDTAPTVSTIVSVVETPATATVTEVGLGTSTTTTASKSIFGIPPPATTATSSIFGTLLTTTTTTASIFGAASTTSTGSVFGSVVTGTSGSLFSSPATTTTVASIFGAVGSQQGPFLSTTASNSAPSFTAVPTATVSSTAFATSAVTPTTVTTTTSSSGFAIPTTSSGSIFGSLPATTTAESVFNMPATTSSSIFGAANATIFGSSGFGAAAPATPSVFSQRTSAGSSVFGSTPTSPIFDGVSKTTTAGPFSAFGSGTTSAFGATTTTSSSVFGQPGVFGSGSVFGAPASSSTNTFGSGFVSGGSVFGSPATTASSFGQSQSSTFSFADAAANVPSTNSSFGFSKPPAFGFGGTPSSTDSNAFSFGNLNVGVTTTANSGFATGFGQSPNSNPFAKPTGQEQKPAFGGGSLFGTPTTTTSSSIFGGGSTSGFGSPTFGTSSAFGSPSGFAQQSAFGQNQNTFGGSFGSPSQPGPFSGGNQSVAQTGFGGFGQTQKPSGFGAAPVFGGSPGGFGSPPNFGGGSSAFGTSPAFGSPTAASSSFGAPTQQENPTFANLATQNTLGFGALAQQSQTNQSMSFSGGGSSFSTWR